jgi:mycobactin lysine-N-oxygenase
MRQGWRSSPTGTFWPQPPKARRDAILAVMPTLAVVGAGPKGIAIAAKARALATAGLDPPRIVLVDRGAVAGNWSGRQGYTSGLLPLGTPPEKDVGFPYPHSWGAASSSVTAAMGDFSWQRHLIAQGSYADWVDRGRLRPTHRQWSSYLRDVAEKARAEIVAGEVVAVEADGEQWRLMLQAGPEIRAEGVVFTGCGGRWPGRRWPRASA